MRSALLIARRDAYAYLRSPLGAAVIAAVLLGEGLYFYWSGLTERRVSAEVLQDFFNIASGGILLATPVLSMRLVAEERQTGTMTLLNTAPVRDRDIVLGVRELDGRAEVTDESLTRVVPKLEIVFDVRSGISRSIWD